MAIGTASTSRIVKGSTSKPISTALTVALGGMLSVNGRRLVMCEWVTCNELRLKVESALINESQRTSNVGLNW